MTKAQEELLISARMALVRIHIFNQDRLKELYELGFPPGECERQDLGCEKRLQKAIEAVQAESAEHLSKSLVG